MGDELLTFHEYEARRKRESAEKMGKYGTAIILALIFGIPIFGWVKDNVTGPAHDSKRCAQGAVTRGANEAMDLMAEGLLTPQYVANLAGDRTKQGQIGWAVCMIDKGYDCSPTPTPSCGNGTAFLPPPTAFPE